MSEACIFVSLSSTDPKDVQVVLSESNLREKEGTSNREELLGAPETAMWATWRIFCCLRVI